MAGVLFVVCVPTAKHEIELTEKPKSFRDEEHATSALNVKQKTDFHKSESYLFKNNLNHHNSSNQNNNVSQLNPSGTKLFRAVTTGALDQVGDDKLLIPEKKNTLVPPQPFIQPPQKSKSKNNVNHGSTHSLNVPTLSVPAGSAANLDGATNQALVEDPTDEFFLQYDKIPMEKVLTKVLAKLKIENAVWCPGKNNNFYQVIFSTSSGEPCEECLQCLQDLGIGQRLNSVVSVIPCSLYYEGQEQEAAACRAGFEGSSDEDLAGSDEKLREQSNKQMSAWAKFVSSVRARLTVAQVVEQVRANAELTFDFFMLLLVAGLVAALGLVENSSVILVASMLISPLMGPILAGTFGTVIQDRQLQRVGVLHELFGLLMCLVIGFFFGLVIASLDDAWGTGEWPTAEMVARGQVRALWVGCLIALPSGAGVALSVLGGNAGSLVGVAISASLLPPAVNAGLLWALAVIELLRATSDPYHYLSHDMEERLNGTDTTTNFYSNYKPAELAALGAVSLCLTLLNIACIFVAGIIVLKIKEVAPKTSREDMDVFWKHDIKIARDYNRTMHGDEGKNLGNQLMKELAGMSSDKLNAVVDEATRDDILAKIRRLSLMNGPNYNDLTITSTGIHPRSNQSTWSPNTGTMSRPTVQELEDLYATLTGTRQSRPFAPPMPRRYSVSAGAAARRVSVGRSVQPTPPPMPHHLATIMEGNSPAGTPVQLRHTAGGLRRPSAGQNNNQASPTSPTPSAVTSPSAGSNREGSMRFVVTPAKEDPNRARPTAVEMKSRAQSPNKKFSF